MVSVGNFFTIDNDRMIAVTSEGEIDSGGFSYVSFVSPRLCPVHNSVTEINVKNDLSGLKILFDGTYKQSCSLPRDFCASL